MNKKGQYVASVGSAIALVLVLAVGAIIVSQMTGTFVPADNVSNSVEDSVRDVTETGGTTFNLLTIVVIVGVITLMVIFISSSLGAFGGEFE